ncbi:ferric-dicitrate binding protein FerR (iron transport regulator) [Pedobacter sp. AK017]|uniref:FecR family protein n=1 Tax=Pedobacter sp. AK017 TaxID=2723073 RepID=UPI00161BB075|nr:FecR family protein [Pedobacter sp. AK017]MBB5440933.1 ferric-dicitrate binding protein FerR (iron transport regulator) [Pedobacter sp. AK017]
MNRKEAQELFDRYTANLCTPEERAIVERWYAKESDLQQLPEVKDVSGAKNEIWDGVLKQAGLAEPARKSPLRIWISSAAAVFILMAAGFYFYISKFSPAPLGKQQTITDVMPGGDRAVLTLADGSTIILDQAKKGILASEGNTSVSKTGNGQLKYDVLKNGPGTKTAVTYNTVSTPKGGQYHVILPDGTGVWLNAVSSIKFPTSFANKERNVEITGEAYFEVKANAASPFIVKAGETNVRVLGTHFNVMAYADEVSVNTTLLEGRVKVFAGKNVSTIMPGQQAVTAKGMIHVANVDVEEAIAWKNGYFYFKDADVKTVMRQISRWYDVDVEYKGTDSETAFSGKMHRNVNISKVLEMLSYFKIDYKIIDSRFHKGKKTIVIN